jgi:hypothetical protein
MSSMPNAMSNKILNFVLTGGSTCLPGSVYIGLSTSSPGSTGSIAGEPTIGTGNYARVQITQNTTTWSTAASGQITNGNATITFPTSNAAWSSGATPLTNWFLIDASSGSGTLGVIAYGTLTPATDTVNATGVTLSFALSQLTITMA